MRSYNDSIFALRSKYNDVFWEDQFQVKSEEEEEEVVDSSKLYKISYKINMLPILSEYILDNITGDE